MAIVGRNVRQILCITDDVIACEADGSSTETREIRQRGRMILGDFGVEHFQGIVTGELAFLHADVIDRNLLAGCRKNQKRITPRKTIATDSLTTDDALKQKRPGPGCDSLVGCHGGQRVGRQLSVNRNKPRVAGKLLEFGRCRQ